MATLQPKALRFLAGLRHCGPLGLNVRQVRTPAERVLVRDLIVAGLVERFRPSAPQGDDYHGGLGLVDDRLRLTDAGRAALEAGSIP